jgi:AcrR family transcriptional regulator
MPAPDRLKARKRPRQERSRSTVDVLLRAAAQVFATRGYAATTTNHIAARAGVSIGSLYEYFPSKDALLVALMEAHLAEGETILEQAGADALARGGDDLEQVVRYFVEGMVTFHERDRALHRVLFEEAPFPRHVRKRLGDIETRVVSLVEQFLRTHPTVTRRDPALGAAVVVHAVEALTHKLVVHESPAVSAGAYVDEMVDLVMAYLTAGASRPARAPRAARRASRA